MDSVVFGMWAFVAGCRSTMAFFYQHGKTTSSSSSRQLGRINWQAANTLRGLKIYLPVLEIMLFCLMLYTLGGPLYLVAYLTYCVAAAMRFVVTSKLDGVRIWAGRYELSFQATHKAYGFLLPLLSIASLVFEHPVMAGLIGFFGVWHFTKHFVGLRQTFSLCGL